jgi:Reverse transcriptase (RNA-dependent DNA polymerase)
MQQHRYLMNPNYALKVKEEIQLLLDANFIKPINQYSWLSPIVVVPKKTEKLRVCIDYRRLNDQTVKDPFPVPFLEASLDQVAGNEAYSLMDGFSGYNQVRMDGEARKFTTFITEWGAFQWLVLPFGLCNGPSTFQRLMMMMFHEFLNHFMQVYIDDFVVYGRTCDHLEKLRKCLSKCKEGG